MLARAFWRATRRAAARSHAMAFLLACGVAGVGCQVIAGISGLEVAEGTGGAAGHGGHGASTSTSSTASSGGGDAGCTKASDCGTDTECQTFTCDDGCHTMNADKGKPCGDGGGDLCDGMGLCVPPSCTDRLQNDGESDVDCGGPCTGCDDDEKCTKHMDCKSGFCDESGPQALCKPKKSAGDTCADDVECGTDHCTEGVCCDVADCQNACLSCAIAGQEGSCKPDAGASCGSSTDDACTNPDTCDNAGNCLPNHAVGGTPCGDNSDTECTNPDSCDGSGNCLPNHALNGTPCGDAGDTDCTNPDTCDGAGVCKSNHAVNGAACGNTCAADMFTPAGTCNGSGACSTQPQACPNLYGCNAGGTACATMCSSSAQCASNAFCGPGPMQCLACGSSAPAGSCSGCEACVGGNICVTNCDTGGECTSNLNVDTGPVAKQINCGSQCNNITIMCGGPHTCEIVCDNGGCTNLVLNCGSDTICKLTCNAGGCMGAVTMNCGDNTCSAVCAGQFPVNQQCNGSCSCTKQACM